MILHHKSLEVFTSRRGPHPCFCPAPLEVEITKQAFFVTRPYHPSESLSANEKKLKHHTIHIFCLVLTVVGPERLATIKMVDDQQNIF